MHSETGRSGTGDTEEVPPSMMKLLLAYRPRVSLSFEKWQVMEQTA